MRYSSSFFHYSGWVDRFGLVVSGRVGQFGLVGLGGLVEFVGSVLAGCVCWVVAEWQNLGLAMTRSRVMFPQRISFLCVLFL